MKEIWKNIENFENYQISNLGNVKNDKGKVLKGWITRGYHYVTLLNNGIKKKCRVHRLVAQAFMPNPYNYPCINHKDENKSNNCVDNLEWCTQKENLNKYFAPRRPLGYKAKIIKPKISNYHNRKKVLQYDLNKNFIQMWNSTMDIERQLHIRSGNISLCCRGIKLTAGGYIWEYADK